MPLSTGLRLGPYEIVGRLGEGGMGEVYRARDTRLGRDVAVKVVAANHSESPTAAARFDREWRVVARLSHPNILSVHDVGHHDGVTFAVAELVPGESLRRRLLAGPLPVRKALDFAIQIARGLGAAHQAGIVHRDLKPENIIVTPDGHVKILDFGLARPQSNGEVDDSTALIDITESGVVLGTRGYMAPEQAKGQVADQRADIFAFGSVLYEMLTGDRAFGGASPVEVLNAVIAKEPDAAKLSSTHPAIRRVVARCLEKRREERFSSAQDLAYALEAAGDALSGSGSGPSYPVTTGTGRRGVMLLLAAVALIASGVVVGQFLLKDRERGHVRLASVAMRAQIAVPAGATEVTFSPDGRRLAAIAYPGSGQSALWMRDVSSSEWRRIAPINVQHDSSWCAWSPDGESILYPAIVDGLARLRIVTVSSGAVRTLEKRPFSKLEATGRQLLVEARGGGAWSRESGVLIGGPRLLSVSPETGATHDLIDADPSVDWQIWPSFLPDGKSFVFTQGSADENKRGVFLGQIGSGRVTRILDAVANAQVTRSGHLLFAQNGALLASTFNQNTRAVEGESRLIASGLPYSSTDYSWFSVSPANVLALPTSDGEAAATTSRLLVFGRTGIQERELGAPDSYVAIDLSTDGRRLVIQSTRPVFDILDLDRGLRVPLGSVSPGVTFESPAWLGDGDVAATQYGAVERNLASIDGATGKVTVLLKTEQARWPQAWARHTREVVAIRWEPDGSSLWAIPVASPQAERRLSPKGAYIVAKASVSPDNRWLAYSSNETGDFEVYVQPFGGGGQRRRVSSTGGLQPRWRPDGRELFYLEPDGTLVAVPVSASMQVGRTAQLFKLGARPRSNVWQYAVLPDASRVLAAVPTQTQTDSVISIVTDWTQALGK